MPPLLSPTGGAPVPLLESRSLHSQHKPILFYSSLSWSQGKECHSCTRMLSRHLSHPPYHIHLNHPPSFQQSTTITQTSLDHTQNKQIHVITDLSYIASSKILQTIFISRRYSFHVSPSPTSYWPIVETILMEIHTLQYAAKLGGWPPCHKHLFFCSLSQLIKHSNHFKWSGHLQLGLLIFDAGEHLLEL